MVTVIFEVELHDGKKEGYLKLAASLAEELSKQPGFISIERFISVANENKMLSLQSWKDEASIVQWRENEKHKKAMPIGYDRYFKNYTISVLTNIRSYGKFTREQAPIDVSKITNKKKEL